MRRRTIFLLLSFLLAPTFVIYCWGQLSPQLTMYMFNMYSFNPACAGLGNNIGASLSHRQQNYGFTAIEGDDKTTVFPVSSVLLADMPIKFIKGGVGLAVSSDKLASYSDISVKMGYSYHLETSLGRVGLGLQLGFIDKNQDFSKFKPTETSDPLLQGKMLTSGFYTDVNIGAFLQSNQNYFVGISMAQVLTSYKEEIHMETTRLLFLNGGYNFSLDELPNFEFTPSTLFKTDLSGAWQWDISAITTYKRQFFGGLSFRWGDAFSVIAGANIKELQLGASYDVNTSKMFKGSTIRGSFELFLKYSFLLETEKKHTNYKNSRYL